MKILIWCMGDSEKGLGHIYREIVLGHTLLSRGHALVYITARKSVGETILRRAFEKVPSVIIHTHRGDTPPASFFARNLADVVIMDVEHGPSRQVIINAKHCSPVVVIGGVGFYIFDQASVDELVDLQVHQSAVVTHEAGLKSTSNFVSGCEYVVIDKHYSLARAVYSLNRSEPRGSKFILVSMGGADPRNLTHPTAESLARAFPANRIIAVYGPASKKANRKFSVPNVEIVESPLPSQFSRLMAESAFVITALGMTVYEALCVGVPVACTAWSEDHEETAQYLQSKNAITYLGTWDNFDTAQMFSFAHNVMAFEEYRDKKTEAGHKLVDGKGAERVADSIECVVMGEDSAYGVWKA